MDIKSCLEKMSSDKGKRNLIVAIGMLGIFLIFISNFISFNGKSSTEVEEEPASNLSADTYKSALEQELTSIVSCIDGVGEVRILITMESSTEDVYAIERSIDDQSESTADESRETAAVQYSEEDTYVKVKNQDGSESLVRLKQVMPKIRGVLVVCGGGGNSSVREKVTQAVSGVLNISSGKVYVTN